MRGLILGIILLVVAFGNVVMSLVTKNTYSCVGWGVVCICAIGDIMRELEKLKEEVK